MTYGRGKSKLCSGRIPPKPEKAATDEKTWKSGDDGTTRWSRRTKVSSIQRSVGAAQLASCVECESDRHVNVARGLDDLGRQPLFGVAAAEGDHHVLGMQVAGIDLTQQVDEHVAGRPGSRVLVLSRANLADRLRVAGVVQLPGALAV